MIINKSIHDDRDYEYLKLENGLELVIISDKNTKEGFASMIVGTGYYDDPKDIPGMAHYLEHMLFLGSTKYPNDSYYHEIIQTNGGMSNAYTAHDHTCYYFSVKSSAFLNTFDIFAQFFIDPIFEPSAVMREINAVDSEHSKNINTNTWKYSEIFKLFCNKNSPVIKFGTGNKQSLDRPDIRDRLLEFYDKYYSSNKMKLCVLVNSSIKEQVKKNIVEACQKIKNKNYIKEKQEKQEKIINKKFRNKIIKVIPSQKKDTLIFFYEIKDPIEQRHLHILDFLFYLISNMGPNTMGDMLLKKGIIGGLETGINFMTKTSSIISIEFSVLNIKNTTGVKLMKKSIEQLIKLIKTKKEKIKELWNDFVKIREYEFQKFTKQNDVTYNNSVVETLLNYPNVETENILTHFYFLQDFSYIEPYLTDIFENMSDTPELIIMGSEQFTEQELMESKSGLLTEKLYQTKFCVDNEESNESSETQYIEEHIEEIFLLPRVNPFINTKRPVSTITQLTNQGLDQSLTLVHPTCVSVSDFQNVYLFCDREFGNPDKNHENENIYISELYLYFIYPDTYKTIENYAISLIFFKYIEFMLNPYIFEINQTNSINLIFSRDRLLINITGEQKNFTAIVKIIKHFMNQEIQQDILNHVRKMFVQEIKSILMSPPFMKIGMIINKHVYKKYYAYKDIMKVVDKISYIDDRDIKNILRKKFNIVYLHAPEIESNRSLQTVLKIAKIIYPKKSNFNKKKYYGNTDINATIRNLSCYEFYEYPDNENENNAVCSVNIPVGYICPQNKKTEWIYKHCMIDIFQNAFSHMFFSDLRTKQQLGYIVKQHTYVTGIPEMPYYYMQFLVQSQHKTPEELKKRINDFIFKMEKFIKNKENNEYFENIIKTGIEILEKKFENVEDKAAYYFNLIITGTDAWDEKQKRIEFLKKILETHKDDLCSYVKEFYDKYIDPNSIVIGCHKKD